MPTRIFITGCARSGTTLLQRLFLAFRNLTLILGESRIDVLIPVEGLYPTVETVLAKRQYNNMFSNTSDVGTSTREVEIITKCDIKVLNIVRDGRDVVEGGYVSPKRWIHSIENYLQYKHLVDYCIRYEDLVTDPDKMQSSLMEHYNLRSGRKFSEYPAFVPDVMFKTSVGNYKPRPIETSRIGKNPELYKQICSNELRDRFETCLKHFKYME